MGNQLRLYLTIACILFSSVPIYSQGTQQEYSISFQPDIWYNNVDGIKVGTVFKGRVFTTDEEGPHRLDGGFWLSTWFPSLPVSYLVSYTEPVPRLSDYGSEFNIRLASSIREGYHNHGAGINKRWEHPSDFRKYWELSIAYSLEKRFDHEYVLFPELWSENWKGIIKPSVHYQTLNRFGFFNMDLQSRVNTIENFFYTTSLSVSQQVSLGSGWLVRARAYGEVINDDSYPEYRLFRSSGSEIATLNRPLSRSKGTVPIRWVHSGNIHFSAGPNLRGYTNQDIQSKTEGNTESYTSAYTFNLELDFPNLVQASIRNIDYISEFLTFRSYLFTDTGTFHGNPDTEMNGFYSNAGAGIALTFNIPDYLGKPRGFVIRYEVPFWLSDPENDNKLQWRHLLGLGATITF